MAPPCKYHVCCPRLCDPHCPLLQFVDSDEVLAVRSIFGSERGTLAHLFEIASPPIRFNVARGLYFEAFLWNRNRIGGVLEEKNQSDASFFSTVPVPFSALALESEQAKAVGPIPLPLPLQKLARKSSKCFFHAMDKQTECPTDCIFKPVFPPSSDIEVFAQIHELFVCNQTVERLFARQRVPGLALSPDLCRRTWKALVFDAKLWIEHLDGGPLHCCDAAEVCAPPNPQPEAQITSTSARNGLFWPCAIGASAFLAMAILLGVSISVAAGVSFFFGPLLLLLFGLLLF